MQNVQEPITKASPEVRQIIMKVLDAEKQKLYLDRPHLVNDVVAIIKGAVQ